jgi:inward rectifier potassium channel
MLALSWTIVHSITENSILFDFTPQDFTDKDVEIYVLISAYDDTFGQTVHSRSSYMGSEIVNNARFKRPFYTDDNGNTVLDVLSLGEYDLL